MARVKILPEILSNKIAAGEVVERPASVVKELVENSLDAGSTRILLTLENAGKTLVRVSDNGSGMSRDDTLLAIERYATSKISTDKDLFSITSLGFRGEALPSIASVSKFSMESRDALSDIGTRVEVEGGKVVSVSDAGLPVGTQISVQQLFYNIPARRKFLKTVETEMGHVVDAVSSIALAWPQTQFQLVHNGKPVKTWPAAEDMSVRVLDVVGRDLEGELFPVSFSQDGVSLEGWVSSGRTVRSTTRGIYLYVNRRFVRDSVIRHALMAGFSGKILGGRFPVAVLFLTVPPDIVDVNVHPTKHMVRFSDPRTIHRLIETGVSETLRSLDRPTWSKTPPYAAPSAVSEDVIPFISEKGEAAKAEALHSTFPAFEQPRRLPPNTPPTVQPASGPGQQQPLFSEKKAFGNLRLIGQLHDTYIVCESNREGLILIDQHAAHERILFEKLKKKAADSLVSAQRLLLPETLELGFSEARMLLPMLPDLSTFGFDIEPFGGNTFVVKTAPALVADKEIAPLIAEIAEKAADTGFAPELAAPLDRIRQLIACHGAIRANQRLSPDQMKSLLAQLDACDTPASCPHGRPTWIEWRLPAIEKSFHRIV